MNARRCSRGSTARGFGKRVRRDEKTRKWYFISFQLFVIVIEDVFEFPFEKGPRERQFYRRTNACPFTVAVLHVVLKNACR